MQQQFKETTSVGQNRPKGFAVAVVGVRPY